MKILFTYLKPFKWLIVLVLVLSAMNTGFSLFDPIIFGKLVTLSNEYLKNTAEYTSSRFFTQRYNSVLWLLLASIGVAGATSVGLTVLASSGRSSCSGIVKK